MYRCGINCCCVCIVFQKESVDKQEKAHGISQEMSDIVVYCQPTKAFDIESESVDSFKPLFSCYFPNH